MTENKHHEGRGLPALDMLRQDARFAFRSLRRDRAFTLMAVLILALQCTEWLLRRKWGVL